jgi:hypothetical protein
MCEVGIVLDRQIDNKSCFTNAFCFVFLDNQNQQDLCCSLIDQVLKIRQVKTPLLKSLIKSECRYFGPSSRISNGPILVSLLLYNTF